MEKTHSVNPKSKCSGYKAVITVPEWGEFEPKARNAHTADELHAMGFYTRWEYALSWGVPSSTAYDRITNLLRSGAMEYRMGLAGGRLQKFYGRKP